MSNNQGNLTGRFSSSNGRMPVVDDIFAKRARMERVKPALKQATVNSLLALVVLIDMRLGSVMRFFEEEWLVLWYIECTLGALLCCNALVYIASYTWTHFWEQPVPVTPKQMKLFRISEKDPGFNVKSPPQTNQPEKRCPGFDSFVLPSATPSPLSRSMAMTPHDTSAASWGSAGSSFGANNSLSSSSWMYYSGANASLDKSGFSDRSPDSALGGATGGLHWRGSSPQVRWHISDERSLDDYLASHEESDRSLSFDLPESSGVLNSSLRLDADTVISQLSHYQKATRSPQTMHGDDLNSSATFSGDSVWKKWSIDKDKLDIWVENLRKWISQTIVKRVDSEIDSINTTLQRLGSSDLRIGEANPSTLQQVALSKGQHVPTLASLLPYLDLNSNHEYLVQRIKELARGGCMSDFRWNSGSQNYRGKPWSDSLPTDSAIVLHLLCTYLNSRLPPDPRFPDGKTFTSQFFYKAPNKPSADKDALCIYQTSVLPPHYRVIVGEDTCDLPKGRNNLFYAILLFLHCIKTKHGGMLGRINLGLSGVNVLCVLDG
uniref:Putative cytochrome n=1 Tax=Rhipicephalus pulchellus TaxID=72859 RepID=L7M7R6_RHIPC